MDADISVGARTEAICVQAALRLYLVAVVCSLDAAGSGDLETVLRMSNEFAED